MRIINIILFIFLLVGCDEKENHELFISENHYADSIMDLINHPIKKPTFHFKGHETHFPVIDTIGMDIKLPEYIVFDQPMDRHHFTHFRQDSLLIYLGNNKCKWVEAWFPINPQPSRGQYYFSMDQIDSVCDYSLDEIIKIK